MNERRKLHQLKVLKVNIHFAVAILKTIGQHYRLTHLLVMTNPELSTGNKSATKFFGQHLSVLRWV